jgi:hypothetical protein
MILQILILVFSLPSIWLITSKKPYAKYGYVCGFLGQPFWFISAYQTNSWAIMLLSFWYAYSWGRGVYNHFLSVNIKVWYRKVMAWWYSEAFMTAFFKWKKAGCGTRTPEDVSVRYFRRKWNKYS